MDREREHIKEMRELGELHVNQLKLKKEELKKLESEKDDLNRQYNALGFFKLSEKNAIKAKITANIAETEKVKKAIEEEKNIINRVEEEVGEKII